MRFQSTLPRRERHPYDTPLSLYYRNFNPRSREGSDVKEIRPVICPLYFNPRSREGSDRYLSIIAKCGGTFQSTLPRRERQSIVDACTDTARNFNPRSREGSDKILMHVHDEVISISIHAPAKGATIDKERAAWSPKFQSTLPRRERLSVHSVKP